MHSLIALTLAALLAVDAHAAGRRPACSDVQTVTAVLDGRYAALTCPEGPITVVVGPAQPLPALGTASVALTTSRRTRRTTATLTDAAGQLYRVTR